MSAEKVCWAYLMRCENGSLYAGWTNDLAHRVHAHRSGEGGAKFTRAFKASRLAFAEPQPDKSAAMRREAALKKLSKAEKEALCARWAAENRPRLCLAGEAEAAEIQRIYGWYVANSTATFRYEAPAGQEFEDWLSAARATGPVVCAKNAAGQVTAFALAHPWRGSWEAYQWDVEATVYCAPDCRAMGAGQAVYMALMQGLKQMGYWNVYAVLADPNPESEAFHTRLGFALEGRNPRCGYKFGRWLGISTWCLALQKGRGTPAPVRPLTEAEAEALCKNV